MKSSDADFLAYRDGRKEASGQELERLIDLIIREQSIIIAKNRELREQGAKHKK